MPDYTNLVKFLRGLSPWAFPEASNKRMQEAADAIEALNHLVDLNTERCEGLRKQLREAQDQYEKHLNELEQQLPKRGEWTNLRISMDGSSSTECSLCGATVYSNFTKNPNYCPNCGAKMEVQDG